MEVSDSLAHYGIKGMRWGHRKNRIVGRKMARIMRSYDSPGVEKTKYDLSSYFDKTESAGKNKPKTSKAEAIAKDADRTVKELSSGILNGMKLVRSLKKQPNYAKSLSDSELRQAIQRIELETRYNSLVNSKSDRKYEITKSALDIIGSATAATASIVGIAATAYAIKKAKG